MYILNVEDDVFKHQAIAKAIHRQFDDVSIEWEKNLEDAMNKIALQEENGKPFDIIITDMWYPKSHNGAEEESGLELISMLREANSDIPIIVCSSVKYRLDNVAGCVRYSSDSDWEYDLFELISFL